MDQYRHGMCSTKVPEDPADHESDADLHPSPTPRTLSRSTVVIKLVHFDRARHSDLTGRFPIQSINGSQYVMVMICENYIHLEPMNTRSGPDYLKAYRNGHDYFKNHGITPVYERLDNETSKLLGRYCTDQTPRISIQYVPPHDHRTNRAERAIRTWKNHFIATLCTLDPTIPLVAWDNLLPQT